MAIRRGHALLLRTQYTAIRKQRAECFIEPIVHFSSLSNSHSQDDGWHALKHPLSSNSHFIHKAIYLVESGRTLAGKHLRAVRLRDAVGERELEVLGEELLDVWALDVVGLLELSDLEDLCKYCQPSKPNNEGQRERTLIEPKRDLCLAAMSW